jgi:hypothetical protein
MRLFRPLAMLGFMALVAPTGGERAAAQPPASTGAAGGDVAVRTSIDRTALFVGDRATYTVELTCKRGVEVLAEDLSRDTLKLEGLDVVEAATDRQSGSAGTTVYTSQFVVTTLRIDAPVLRIAPFTVRYAVRRQSQRLEDAVPAGDVQVPGVTLAFRSVLPDEQEPAGIRADKPPHARPARFAALQPIGIGLVIVSIVPALAAIAALARRAWRPRVRRSARIVRQEERESLETVRAMAVDSLERRREAFTKLDALVREHLSQACGVAGASLTAQEVPAALAASRTTVPAELVASVLATCEIARYGPPHIMPSADECRRAIDEVEQIVR